LDVPIGACWYVGDTQDRDLVAGRRAGAGAVIITRCHHTDTPPFTVGETADAVLDTPASILDLVAEAPVATDHTNPIREAASQATATAGPRTGALPRLRTALRSPYCGRGLLIDHGGVIATSSADPQARAQFLTRLADLVGLGGEHADPARASAGLEAAASQ